MEKLAYIYEHEPHKHPELSQKERDKRIQKIVELTGRLKELLIKVKLASGGSGLDQSLDDPEVQSLFKGNDGEYDSTRHKDEKQIITLQKHMLNEQDKQLEEIEGIVKSINYNN